MTSFLPNSVDAEKPRPAVPVRQQLMLVGAILFLLLGGAGANKLAAVFHTSDGTESAQATSTPQAPGIDVADPFVDVKLSGKAAYVYDIQNDEVLFSSNPDAELPLASVTKLMTAMVAHELLSEGATVQVGETALRQDGYSDLLLDERFSRQTLSDLTLISSTNDGAYALAAAAGATLNQSDPAAAFVKAMNIRANELGLEHTYFKNPSGLDIDSNTAGSYGSARDISMLMRHIVTTYPELLAATTEKTAQFTSEDGYTHEGINTNYYIDEIPGLIGSKTGYTALAGGNLVVAFDAGLNRPVIVTVLGSTRHERFTDVMQLVDAATLHIASNQ